jgi:predicted GTPase
MVLTVFSSSVECLKKGYITTLKNKAKAPYTILLVGETGVGKSSLFEFIANVFAGNDIDHYNFTCSITPTSEVVLTTRARPTRPAFTNLRARTA